MKIFRVQETRTSGIWFSGLQVQTTDLLKYCILIGCKENISKIHEFWLDDENKIRDVRTFFVENKNSFLEDVFQELQDVFNNSSSTTSRVLFKNRLCFYQYWLILPWKLHFCKNNLLFLLHIARVSLTFEKWSKQTACQNACDSAKRNKLLCLSRNGSGQWYCDHVNFN